VRTFGEKGRSSVLLMFFDVKQYSLGSYCNIPSGLTPGRYLLTILFYLTVNHIVYWITIGQVNKGIQEKIFSVLSVGQ
jgi:hypothetical protein